LISAQPRDLLRSFVAVANHRYACMSRPFHPIQPPAPKHDREVLMAMPDGKLAWVDDGGVVSMQEIVRRHCERRERERRRDGPDWL
jgi:hypothetical protein